MKRYLFYVVLISLFLRIPFLFFVAANPAAPYTSHDSIGYDAIARNLLEHRSFSIYPHDPQVKDPVRTPGYPFFLTAIYAVFPNSAFFVVLLQILLDTSVVILLFFFGKVLVSRAAGFAAALLYALNIHQMFFTTQVLTEVLFTTVLMLALFSFLLYTRNGRGQMLFSSALCFGLAILIRPIALFLPVIPIVFLAKRKRAFRAIVPFVLIVIVFPALWTVHNGVVFKQFFFTKIHAVNLVLYHAPSIIGDVEQVSRDEGKRILFSELEEKYGLTDYEMDYFDDNPQLTDKLAREAKGIVRAYPLLFFKHHFIGTIKVLLPLNVGFTADILRGKGAGGVDFKPVFSLFWQLVLRGKAGRAVKLLVDERIAKLSPGTWLLFVFMTLYQIAVYCLAILGLSRRRIPGVTLFLCLVVAYFILIPGVVGEARFRVPVEPIFAFLAGAGIWRLKAKWAQRAARCN